MSGGRPSTSDSIEGSGSSKRRYAPSGVDTQRGPKLGKTTGIFAAGAWAARMEIARLLEAGVSAESIISEINSGQESEEPLAQGGAPSPPESTVKEIRDSENEDRRKRTSREVYSPGLPSNPKERRGRSEDDRRTEPSRSKPVVFVEGRRTKSFEFPAAPDHPPPGRFTTREPAKVPTAAKTKPGGLSGGAQSSTSGGGPSWTSGGVTRPVFQKKAEAPKASSEIDSPTSPAEVAERDTAKGPDGVPSPLGTPPEKFGVPPGIGGLRKKAGQGPNLGEEDEVPKDLAPVQKKRPFRRSVLDEEKLVTFDKMCQNIFGDLVIFEVKMDLLADVVNESGQLDEKKLKAFTQPRSPGTGIRYSRLMKTYIAELNAKYTSENRPEVFGATAMQSHIFKMIDDEVGFMTPLSFIYAVEHFSTIFGFHAPGAKNPRVRRFATDYSKKAPEKKQAPPFSVASFLDYMEKSVLDNKKPLEFRLVLGKLRLCTQGSMRHSDLATTALNRVEWCRVVGEEKVLGLRAKADKTKTGPRPWSASMLGVNVQNDEWLIAFVGLLFKVHGPNWKTHPFLGCKQDGKGGFTCSPPTSEDVILVKQALEEDLRKGVPIPLTEQEIKGFRWHSCKNTLPSLMVHCGVRTRSIRHQGAWRKASESMVDLYLRETQVLVIKAQLEILDQIRKGVTLNILEGKPLDHLPEKPGWGPHSALFSHWPPVGTTVEQASEAMEAASVCDQEGDGESLTVRENGKRHPRDLPDGFKDEMMRSESHLSLTAEQEKTIMEFERKKLDAAEEDSSQESSVSSWDSDESEVEPSKGDMAMLPHYVNASSGSGKVHKPAEIPGGFVEPCKPSCGVRGRDFSILSLEENWGSYSLCERCFGKKGPCQHLCEYGEFRKGTWLRCSRRCERDVEDLNHDPDEPVGSSKHMCPIHLD